MIPDHDEDAIHIAEADSHAHPDGTRSGATALVQAMDAYEKGISIDEYAKDHEELAKAIEFFTKK